MKKENGFSLAELLVSVALIGIIATSLFGVFNLIYQARRHTDVVSRAIETESYLLSAIDDVQSYPDSIKSAMLEQTELTAAELAAWKIKLDPNGTQVISPDSKEVKYTSADGISFMLRLSAIQKADKSYGFAYSIRLDSTDDPNSPTINWSSGSTNKGTFVESDYNWTVPQTKITTLAKCDPETTLGIAYGFNSRTTRPLCFSRPDLSAGSCAFGSMAVGLVYDPSKRQFSVLCTRLSKASCPAGYVLNSIDSSDFLSTDKSKSKCVHAGEKVATWSQVQNGVSVVREFGDAKRLESQTACPQNYEIDATASYCEVVNYIDSGMCSRQFSCANPIVTTFEDFSDFMQPKICTRSEVKCSPKPTGRATGTKITLETINSNKGFRCALPADAADSEYVRLKKLVCKLTIPDRMPASIKH